MTNLASSEYTRPPVADESRSEDHDEYKTDLDNANKDADEDGVAANIKQVIPWKYRLVAFTFIVFWGTALTFADQTLGPLKSTMIRELGVTSRSSMAMRDRRLTKRCSIRRNFKLERIHQFGPSHYRWDWYGPFRSFKVSRGAS